MAVGVSSQRGSSDNQEYISNFSHFHFFQMPSKTRGHKSMATTSHVAMYLSITRALLRFHANKISQSGSSLDRLYDVTLTRRFCRGEKLQCIDISSDVREIKHVPVEHAVVPLALDSGYDQSAGSAHTLS
jgi:hypothetical protein